NANFRRAAHAAMDSVRDRGASRDRATDRRLCRLLAGTQLRLVGLARENLLRFFPTGHSDRERFAGGNTPSPARPEIAPGAQRMQEREPVRADFSDRIDNLELAADCR